MEGLPTGDRLFQFFARSSDGKTEYFVAVHEISNGGFRTACQCRRAIFNLARSQNAPCCKHAAEALKIVAWNLRAKEKR